MNRFVGNIVCWIGCILAAPGRVLISAGQALIDWSDE